MAARTSRLGRTQTLKVALTLAFLAAAPAVIILISVGAAARGSFGFDFQTFWESGRHVLDGTSPYPPPDALGDSAVRNSFRPFVYPAPAALLMVPFALLGYEVALVAFTVLLVAAVVVSLRLFGVRDWRCYGATLATPALWDFLVNGAVTPLLLLGVAVLWAFRDRRWVAACAVAGVVVLKVFLWPLLIWLVVTRRFAAAIAATCLGVAVTLGSWLVLGFDGFREYPALLAKLSDLVGPNSYSPLALALSLGMPSGLAKVGLVAGALICCALLFFLRRRIDEGGLLAVAVVAALAVTPVLWFHYLLLLAAPLALCRPRFGWLWLAPLALWPAFSSWSNGSAARILVLLSVCVVVVAGSFLARRGPTTGRLLTVSPSTSR
jgi:hypothetical protein